MNKLKTDAKLRELIERYAAENIGDNEYFEDAFIRYGINGDSERLFSVAR